MKFESEYKKLPSCTPNFINIYICLISAVYGPSKAKRQNITQGTVILHYCPDSHRCSSSTINKAYHK